MTQGAAHEMENFQSFLVRKEFDASIKNFTSQGLYDLFQEMVEAFLLERAERFHDIHIALRTQNTAALSRSAHGLKGSFLSLGLDSLASLLLEVERQMLSPKADWEIVQKCIAQLDVATEELVRRADLLLLKGSGGATKH
ncbi:MAG: Hpt domain [Pseudomonadota bacterium]